MQQQAVSGLRHGRCKQTTSLMFWQVSAAETLLLPTLAAAASIFSYQVSIRKGELEEQCHRPHIHT